MLGKYARTAGLRFQTLTARRPTITRYKRRVRRLLVLLNQVIMNGFIDLNGLALTMQTAFKYQADNDQFGYEKPFFIEEIFYYPASDCEDRAVLFAYLVRRLLNIEVVLLHYPNHLCTAVLFSEEIEGDGLVIGSKRYLICDPTYIGADIGNLHNDYKLERPKVYTIN